MKACRKLRGTRDIDLIYAHILNTAGAWNDDQGYFDKSPGYFLESLQIRRTYLGEDDDEISGILHNISLSYFNLKQYKECLEYRQQSVNSILPMPESDVRVNKLLKRDFTLARVWIYQGKVTEAEEALLQLLRDSIKAKNWFMEVQ